MRSVFGESRASVADDLSVDEIEGGHFYPLSVSVELLDGVSRRVGNEVPFRDEGSFRRVVGIVDTELRSDVWIDDRLDRRGDAKPFGFGNWGRDDLDRISRGVGSKGGQSLGVGDFDVACFGYVVP